MVRGKVDFINKILSLTVCLISSQRSLNSSGMKMNYGIRLSISSGWMINCRRLIFDVEEILALKIKIPIDSELRRSLNLPNEWVNELLADLGHFLSTQRSFLFVCILIHSACHRERKIFLIRISSSLIIIKMTWNERIFSHNLCHKMFHCERQWWWRG